MNQAVDLTGNRYGALFVVGRAPKRGKVSRWFCRCACGIEFETRSDKLRLGMSACKSCSRIHYSNDLTTRYPSEYTTWRQMRLRCSSPTRPSARYYYERGITVCERWDRFDNFMADMGPKPSAIHSIDRIDNDGNYEPSNCRWATPLEQSLNRRRVKRKAA